MLMLKCIMLFAVFSTSSIIGFKISSRYVERAKNLKDIKKALNIFESKIIYTYEPIPDVFLEISKKIKGDVGYLFFKASQNMQLDFAGDAWEKSIDTCNLQLKEDDKEALKSLGKLLGNTDIDGQVNQIKLVISFINEQIEDAVESKNKSEKMYKKLGIIVGLAIVVVLV